MTVQTDRDMLASGLSTLDFPPQLDLYAGDAPVFTDRGTAGADLVIYQAVGRNAALAIVPHDPTAVSSVAVAHATGTVTFSANPAANDTVTIGGVAITFKASGATGSQVNIGADITATALALANFINGEIETLGVYASAALGVTTITAEAAGTGGNSITLAKSGTNIAVSGSTLAGGTNTSMSSPEARLIGFTCQACASGDSVPFYAGGFFNHLRMIWHISLDTLLKRQAVCDGKTLKVGQLL